MEEIYKPIPGFDGYEVSNLGNVRNTETGSMQSQYLYKSGYLYTNIYQNGKRKFVRTHRLVAQTWLPNPDNLPDVNHKDEDKTNNCVENLEWCTRKYNNNHGTRNIRVSMSLSGVKKNEESVLKMINSLKGRKLSDGAKGYKWKLVDGKRIYYKPEN